jgi:hypothetical protein
MKLQRVKSVTDQHHEIKADKRWPLSEVNINQEKTHLGVVTGRTAVQLYKVQIDQEQAWVRRLRQVSTVQLCWVIIGSSGQLGSRPRLRHVSSSPHFRRLEQLRSWRLLGA